MKLFSLLLFTFAFFSCKPKVDYPKDNSTPRPTLEKDGWEIIAEFDPVKMLSDKTYYTKFFNIGYSDETGPNVAENGEVDGGDVYLIRITYNGKPDEAALKLIEYVKKKVKEESFHKVEGFYNHKKNEAPTTYVKLLDKLPQALLEKKEKFLSEESGGIDVDVLDSFGDGPIATLEKYTYKTPPTNRVSLWIYYFEPIGN